MTREEHRDNVLTRLSAALRDDERIAGAVLVGSGATGFIDDESDIDLAAPVASGYDAKAVFEDWQIRIEALLAPYYSAETAFTAQHHLMVLLCDGPLEIDLSFPALESLVPLRPTWRVLWDRSGDVERRMSAHVEPRRVDPPQTYIWALNRCMHRALYASKALKRAQLWKAILLLDELRTRTLQLACLHVLGDTFSDPLGTDGVERHADSLPPEILAELARTIPAGADIASLRASLDACAHGILTHAAALDERYNIARPTPLAEILHDRLR
jgi:hypothetical protein